MPHSSSPGSSTLSPAQELAKASLKRGLEIAAVAILLGEIGRGKSTVLAELARESGAALIGLADILLETANNHPLAIEESFFHVIETALQQSDVVVVDQFEAIYQISHGHAYPRSGWMDAVCAALCEKALRAGKKLVCSSSAILPPPFHQRAFKAGIERFKVEDYRAIVDNYLPRVSESIDFEKVFRFAPKLNGYQLRATCEWLLRFEPHIDTNTFIDYLRSQRLTSNVDLGEVQQVTLDDLVGVEDVVRSLEIHIALPLENEALAGELSLRPKRGVLLYGPPGTGKTSVGRALAHRLKGKFFLIDGTIIAGTHEFYNRINQVFESAKENAPAVIFIDDADAIFEGGEEQGLYRYLLTMMDGLESESAGRICVMMTAMDVGHLPLALVRSGRVELWLEMKLPNSEARRTILHRQLSKSGLVANGVTEAVIDATDSFTGADLKRVVEDAKSFLAFDRISGAEETSSTDYLLKAIDSVSLNKKRYAEAEARAKQPGRMAHPLMNFLSQHGGVASSVFFNE